MTTNHDSEQAFRDLQADRRLRDAAPELLAALQSIEGKARSLADDPEQSNRGFWTACADEARAAIAKAIQP